MATESKSNPNNHLGVCVGEKPPVCRRFAEINKTVACLRPKGTQHMAVESFGRSLESAKLWPASPGQSNSCYSAVDSFVG